MGRHQGVKVVVYSLAPFLLLYVLFLLGTTTAAAAFALVVHRPQHHHRTTWKARPRKNERILVPQNTHSSTRSRTSLKLTSFSRSSSLSSSSTPENEGVSKEKKNDVLNDEVEFLQSELQHIASMEEILDELEMDALPDHDEDESSNDDDDLWTEESIVDFLEILEQDNDDLLEEDDIDDQSEENDDMMDDDDDYLEEITIAMAASNMDSISSSSNSNSASSTIEDNISISSTRDLERMEERIRLQAASDLEAALQQGLVVPMAENELLVGSDTLAGDFGFDPLNLAEKDYFKQAQDFLLSLVPQKENRYDGLETKQDGADSSLSSTTDSETTSSAATPRPKALILRDYREAEIRHGRLAMLAAVFWPLQEILDKFVLSTPNYGPILWGPPVTLPYFPLTMTAIMLLLGYLDIYSQEIKDTDDIGEAFAPGDCFWDPLKILQGGDARMKRNMQERELFNGRVAMIAVAVFIWEELTTHKALIDIPGNELLLEPAYQVPFIQSWLDEQFSDYSISISSDIVSSALLPVVTTTTTVAATQPSTETLDTTITVATSIIHDAIISSLL